MRRYEDGRKVLREKSLPGQGTFASATETVQSTMQTGTEEDSGNNRRRGG